MPTYRQATIKTNNAQQPASPSRIDKSTSKHYDNQKEAAHKQEIKLANRDQGKAKEILFNIEWHHDPLLSLAWNTRDKVLVLNLLGYANVMATQLALALIENFDLKEAINAEGMSPS